MKCLMSNFGIRISFINEENKMIFPFVKFILFTLDQTFQDPSELLQYVRRDPQDQKFYCTLCEKFSHKVKPLARNHVESQHFPNMFNYPCDQCEESFDTKTKYNHHRARKHKQNKNIQFYNV